MPSIPSQNEILIALTAAGKAHHDYQENMLNGKHDAQWPGWYAAYVLGRLGDFTSPSQLTGWLANTPSGDDWNTSAALYVLHQMENEGKQ
ncbi:hypothetical protein QQ020_31280 [Fulvivirgaceae bacterium BMA12]|uniref:Uncharacterized protein n=1 Tax=Agaribacillus aureus TaxID=3051825 RepID=A0ABT8LFM6_9BACT|nr:hypothetical protein [Fulvivirgaceae bacterium BMA12]